MQTFEFHFNPKLKEGYIFDSFVYEPENVYEKKLGSIYLVGEIQNTLPQNLNFLDNISNIFKKNYYSLSFKNPEKAFSQTLKKTNDFLAEEVKKENVSWLGNLNFALLSIKDLDLFFSKTGELKVLLIRAGKIINIGKTLESQEIEPYPLKIFFNVVSGRLTPDDTILVLTKEVFDFFQEQNILAKIALAEKIDSKTIKEILPTRLFQKGRGSKVSGICFLTVVKAEVRSVKKPILYQEEKKFRHFKMPDIKWKSLLSKFSKLPKLPGLFKFPKLPKIPKEKLPKAKSVLLEKFKPEKNLKKKLILVLILACLLLLGFLIFGRREIKKELVSEITQIETAELERINKLERIESPEEAPETEYKAVSAPLLLPENLVPIESNFNFDIVASYFSHLYFLDKNNCRIVRYPFLGGANWGSGQIWKEPDQYCSQPKSMAIDGSIWLLNKDNSLLRYYRGDFQETISLDIFPIVENITKIATKAEIAELYLLEPLNKRVIIISKKPARNASHSDAGGGEIIKQFQSEKFDNLTDFAISEDGKTIYLKNNSTIYKIEI